MQWSRSIVSWLGLPVGLWSNFEVASLDIQLKKQVWREGVGEGCMRLHGASSELQNICYSKSDANPEILANISFFINHLNNQWSGTVS